MPQKLAIVLQFVILCCVHLVMFVLFCFSCEYPNMVFKLSLLRKNSEIQIVVSSWRQSCYSDQKFIVCILCVMFVCVCVC